MSRIPPMSSNTLATLDGMKAGVTGAKQSVPQGDAQQTSLDRASKFGGTVSIFTGLTGLFLGKFKHLETAYPHAVSVTKELKGSAGFVPGLINTAVGVHNRDKVQIGLGVANTFLATGFFKAFDKIAAESPNMAFKNAPNQVKAFVAVTTIAYGCYQLATGMWNSPRP